MKKPRFIQQAYAFLNGFFWLPCPLCGQKFGGHEWELGPYHSIPNPDKTGGKGICPDCGKKRAREAAEAEKEEKRVRDPQDLR